MNRDELLKRQRDTYASMRTEQQQWVPMWRQLNEAFYPFIYGSLLGTTAVAGAQYRNTRMLDGEPAQALLILSAGFMNGVTSPARKWVNVKRPGAEAYDDPDAGTSVAHSRTRDKLLEILAGSNYYDSRAVQVYDSAGLGTGALLCYEDRDTVVKFVVCPPGTYSIETDSSNEVIRFAREFKLTAAQLLDEFGESVLAANILERAKAGGAQARTEYIVHHLIEANADDGLLKVRTPFRESYWLASRQSMAEPFLATRPLYEWPAAVLRWSCPDNCTYGIPPTLTVLGKAIQLQNLEFKSDQGLDKLISPPLLAHVQLKNRPKAFSANGITFTSDVGLNSGARPVYQLQVPFQELEIKRARIVQSIKEGLFNHLFDMISQLDTVRSATEIDARREEKLVMLGPVLHRSYLEDIGVVIQRVYGIAKRKGLMPELPADAGASIEFSNVLSDVQKASDVATIERFTEYVGRVIPVFPEAQPKIQILDLIKQYAEGLGIRPTALTADEDAMAANDAQGMMAELQQTAGIAKDFGAAASSLQDVDVGAGLEAVQGIMGG